MNNKKIPSLILIGMFTSLIIITSIKITVSKPSILINQVGYYPEQPKIIAIQHESRLEFNSINLMYADNSSLVDIFPVSYLGYCWNNYYYNANLTNFKQPGEYKIQFNWNGKNIESSVFTIDIDIYSTAIERAYQFFYYQRSNSKTYELVKGYPGTEQSHMDDGIIMDGEWRDLYGGWFSAGDYSKHNLWGSHIMGTIFALAYAYEANPYFFDKIDDYNFEGELVPNSVPDIIDEMMWGIQYALKCIYPNGSIIGSFEGTLKMAAPEFDTDQIIGTEDDRKPTEGLEFADPTNSMWTTASLLKSMNILNKTGYYSDYYEELEMHAVQLYNNYSVFYNTSKENWFADSALPFMIASYELNKTFPSQILESNFYWAAEAISNDINNRGEISSWEDLGLTERALGLLTEYAIKLNNKSLLEWAKDAQLSRWNRFSRQFLLDEENLFKLIKMNNTRSERLGEIIFPEWLGANSLYLYYSYALNMGSKLFTNVQGYENFGIASKMVLLKTYLLDWFFGKNPDSICMIEDIGSVNVPAYHHRYSFTYDNPRGAIPGAIPNGYIWKNNSPYMDLTPASGGSTTVQAINFRSNEPWLPHNIAFLTTMVNYV